MTAKDCDRARRCQWRGGWRSWGALTGHRRLAETLCMTETSLLAGKVVRQSLPILQPPTAPNSPVLKRLKLPQGELAQFYDGDPGIRYIAYLELLPGNPRGNHYHTHKPEWIYLLTGELSLFVEDLGTKKGEKLTMVAGEIVRIAT